MQVDLSRLVFIAAMAGLAWVGYDQLRDDAQLRTLADETACQGVVCTPKLQKKVRDRFGWTFQYLTYGEHTRSLEVSCQRPLWILGSYRCYVTMLDSAVDERFRRRP